jgi:hypothetical protein
MRVREQLRKTRNKKGEGFTRENLIEIILDQQKEYIQLREENRFLTALSKRGDYFDDFVHASASSLDAMAHVVTALQPVIKKLTY